MKPFVNFPRHIFVGIALLCMLASGCNRQAPPPPVPMADDPGSLGMQRTLQLQAHGTHVSPTNGKGKEELIRADDLLAQVLAEDRLKDGWVRLFDNRTLFGWFSDSKANWRVEDGAIHADSGEVSFLCTTVQHADYELLIEFRSDARTNSGVFLRSSATPQDTTRDCVELNIAPPDNPFPTGSLVQRLKVAPETLGDFDPAQWHQFRVRLQGERIEVWLDDQPIADYTDPTDLRRGFICLQHNSGPVEFREILLKPLGLQDLSTGEDWESSWSKLEKNGESLSVTATDDGIALVGGLGQLESKEQWDDFVLQATYKLARPEVNSGIFFRCIPGEMLEGYECQLNHAVENGNPLFPVDGGAGAIFRRENARVVVGDGTEPTYVTVVAEGLQIATWVNGLQVTDFADTRESNPNPRRGSKRTAGTIALQGHDATTEVEFHRIAVGPIAR
jgi:hypothetical protein